MRRRPIPSVATMVKELIAASVLAPGSEAKIEDLDEVRCKYARHLKQKKDVTLYGLLAYAAVPQELCKIIWYLSRSGMKCIGLCSCNKGDLADCPVVLQARIPALHKALECNYLDGSDDIIVFRELLTKAEARNSREVWIDLEELMYMEWLGGYITSGVFYREETGKACYDRRLQFNSTLGSVSWVNVDEVSPRPVLGVVYDCRCVGSARGAPCPRWLPIAGDTVLQSRA